MAFRVCFPPLLLACALLAFALPASVQAEEKDRNLEPVPPMIAFASREGRRPDDRSPDELARRDIARNFASLGTIVDARNRLVYRIGVLSVPPLVDVLSGDDVTPHWNASLTIAALRGTYGPALELNPALPALARRLTPQPGDFHTAAFAALAVGCFHWPQTLMPSSYARMEGRYEAVPGPRRSVEKAIRALNEARASIIRRINEPQTFLRVAALLAVAKMGGAKARQGVEDFKAPQHQFYPTEQHQAELIARALLEIEDPKPYLKALKNVERRVRAAGALSVAVALLTETPAAWTRENDAFLPILRNPAALTQEDGRAEAAFARGMYALRDGATAEWDALWEMARTHSTEGRVAEAAAQALLFRRDPAFERQIVVWAGNARTVLKSPVLGMLLLRAGELGTEEAVGACEKWLRNRAQRPAANHTWDPRWYAAVGLLRAVNAGRIKSQALRARVVATLQRATTKVLDKRAPFRAALEALLAQHGDQITEAGEKSLFRLPLADLRRLEESFDCPHALLSLDPVDACAHRVNAMTFLMFGLDGIKPTKPGEPVTDKQPERYLRHYLRAFPYFSRLDFLDERGLRRPVELPGDDPKVIDR